VEKNLFNRLAEDKGKKLVRYHGWHGRQMKPNSFSWATPRATQWRIMARALAAKQGVYERADVAKCFGPRWAFRLTRAMEAVEDAYSRFGLSRFDDFAHCVRRAVELEVWQTEWKRWEMEGEWEDYCAQIDAERPPEPEPEPIWEEVDLIPRPVWPAAA